jgi:major type 1 subunit fimbrin (pilin)
MNKVTKVTALSLLVMAGLASMSMQSAYADANDTGTIKFTGQVLDSTCTLDSKSLDVPMGAVTVDAFATAGTTGRKVPFQINLSNCNAKLSGVRVELDGPGDSIQPEFLGLDTGAAAAKGIAIELLDKDAKRVPINSASNEYAITEGSNALDFGARYISTADAVSAGDANASAAFTLLYR